MPPTQVKVRLAPEGNLNIPYTITRKACFSPEDEAIVIVTDDGLCIRKEKQAATADDVFQALVVSGDIRISDLDDHLRANLIPGTTLEKVREALTGASVPIEEMIREEREKYEP